MYNLEAAPFRQRTRVQGRGGQLHASEGRAWRREDSEAVARHDCRGVGRAVTWGLQRWALEGLYEGGGDKGQPVTPASPPGLRLAQSPEH